MIDLKTSMARGVVKRHDENVQLVIDNMAAAMVAALGAVVRQRVRDRGDLAGQRFPGYADEYKGVLVSSRYPDGIDGEDTSSGAERHDTSRSWHSGVVPGSYNVSGAMWRSLSLVAWTVGAAAEFRGSSAGSSANVVDGRSRPTQVANALKAWTVERAHGVQLLALKPAELEAATVAGVQALAHGAEAQLPIEWERGAPPATNMSAIFERALGSRERLQRGT